MLAILSCRGVGSSWLHHYRMLTTAFKRAEIWRSLKTTFCSNLYLSTSDGDGFILLKDDREFIKSGEHLFLSQPTVLRCVWEVATYLDLLGKCILLVLCFCISCQGDHSFFTAD